MGLGRFVRLAMSACTRAGCEKTGTYFSLKSRSILGRQTRRDLTRANAVGQIPITSAGLPFRCVVSSLGGFRSWAAGHRAGPITF